MSRRQIEKELNKDVNTKRSYYTVFYDVKHLSKGKDPSLDLILTKNGRSGRPEGFFAITDNGINRILDECFNEITISDILTNSIRAQDMDYQFVQTYKKNGAQSNNNPITRIFVNDNGKRKQYLIGHKPRNYFKDPFYIVLDKYSKSKFSEIKQSFLPKYFVDNLHEFKRLGIPNIHFIDEPYIRPIIEIIGYHDYYDYGPITIQWISSKLRKDYSTTHNILDKAEIEKVIDDMMRNHLINKIDLSNRLSKTHRELTGTGYLLSHSGLLLLLNYLYQEIISKVDYSPHYMGYPNNLNVSEIMPDFNSKMDILVKNYKHLLPYVFDSRYTNIFNHDGFKLLYIFNILYFRPSHNGSIKSAVLTNFLMFSALQEQKQVDKYYELRKHFESESKEVMQFFIGHIERNYSHKLDRDKAFLYLKSLFNNTDSFSPKVEMFLMFLTHISLALYGISLKDGYKIIPSKQLLNILEKTNLFPFIVNYLLELCELVGIMPIGHHMIYYEKSPTYKTIEDRITFDFYLVYRNLEQEKWESVNKQVRKLTECHDKELNALLEFGKKNLDKYKKRL